MMRLFLSAGEASGDLQGGLLARELRAIDPECELIGLGGRAMEEAGVRLIARCDETGVTGLWEVLRHLPRLRGLLSTLSRELAADPPDALIPIDYPDFNLRLASRARRGGIPVIYYISPQVWAWRAGRIRMIRRLVRRIIVIFPFEEEIYRTAGVPVTYVGHPLVDLLRPRVDRAAMRARLSAGEGEILIALLPGSRRSEVDRILPTLLATRARLRTEPRLRWVVALAPGWRREDLSHSARVDDALPVIAGETHEVLGACDLAVTASGTATLEASLLGVPMIVVYKMHPLTWQLARRLVHVPHIAMANLLAGERIVPEFLQGEANPEALAVEILRWSRSPDLRTEARRKLGVAVASLGTGGAARRAARAILDEVAVK